MRYLIFATVAVAVFTIFVTVFAASANKNEVRALPKWVWVILCLLVPVVGGLLYIFIGRPTSDSSNSRPRTRTLAPDDDPQFLRDLADRLKPDEDGDKDQNGENDK
jgi:hypothetical protein